MKKDHVPCVVQYFIVLRHIRKKPVHLNVLVYLMFITELVKNGVPKQERGYQKAEDSFLNYYLEQKRRKKAQLQEDMKQTTEHRIGR